MRAAPLLLIALSCSDDKAGGPDADPGVPSDPAPDIRVTPLEVDFGAVPLGGEPVSFVVAVRNVGSADLALTDAVLADHDGAITVTALAEDTLGPDVRTDLLVQLTPQVEGPVAARLLVQSDDPDEPTVEVELLATITPPGDTGDTGEEAGCRCPDSFTVNDEETGCEREVVEPATATGDTWSVCPIVPDAAYGRYGARYPGGTFEQSAFWGQDDGVANGRLNTAGVWACDGSGGATTGTDPVDEWIGFTVCLDVEEGGDFLVGVGADNYSRLTVDGALVFEQTELHTRNFNAWWLSVVPLTAGRHTLELEGRNAGSIGAFGAEVSGPFASGSLTTDAEVAAADYAGGLLWTSADAIGAAFPIGEDVGWACPDGSTFDLCAVEPSCVTVETAACE